MGGALSRKGPGKLAGEPACNMSGILPIGEDVCVVKDHGLYCVSMLLVHVSCIRTSRKAVWLSLLYVLYINTFNACYSSRTCSMLYVLQRYRCGNDLAKHGYGLEMRPSPTISDPTRSYVHTSDPHRFHLGSRGRNCSCCLTLIILAAFKNPNSLRRLQALHKRQG